MTEPWVAPDGVLVFPALADAVGDEPPSLALQHTAEGELVAIAYTSLDHLIDDLGPGQCWVAIDHGDVPAVLEGSGVTNVFVDPHVTRQGPNPSS